MLTYKQGPKNRNAPVARAGPKGELEVTKIAIVEVTKIKLEVTRVQLEVTKTELEVTRAFGARRPQNQSRGSFWHFLTLYWPSKGSLGSFLRALRATIRLILPFKIYHFPNICQRINIPRLEAGQGWTK